MRSWSSPVIPPVPLGEPGQLRLYDTAHQAVVPVGPASGTATMYVCGITPYDATHLGHAFTYLTFDLVNRVWRDLGLRVAYAQNVTDVDDPLLERAAATGVDWVALGVAETDRFRADMTALRILAPTDYVKVTDALGLIEAYLDGLRAAGAIYQVDDEYPDWYFAFTGPLGDVSHLDPATMLAVFAERGGDPARSAKRHPLDALVWRQARPGEPAWPSSLGRGRPGWHVQCAAIARATLGDTLDLQGGGADLVFPHHEMCAAEARAATGQPFARALVHSAMVSLGGEKMSKSLGNLVKVSGLVAGGADPMALRLALLAQHYRADWAWTDALLRAGEARLAAWTAVRHGGTSVDFTPYAARVRSSLRDDLRADQALAVIDEWVRASDAATTDHPGARDQMGAVTDALLGVAIV